MSHSEMYIMYVCTCIWWESKAGTSRDVSARSCTCSMFMFNMTYVHALNVSVADIT